MRLSKTVFVSALFSLLLAVAVHADQVDDYVKSQLVERHVPGVAVAVIEKGRVVKLKGYGLASVEFSVPVTTDTVFEIGSVSKQMTAAGIILLVEDGKVGLDEKISKYLLNTPEAWKDVTVRNLLTHTSGIKSYTSLVGFELSQHMKVGDFIKKLSPHPLEFIPGERNIYSNSAFNLLAFIIEARSGKTYLEFMRERIFGPLGMDKTADRDPQYIIPNRATGYEWRIDRLTGRDGNLTDLTGAGSIVSTISDLVKWNSALSGTTFLKPESKREIWKQFTFNDGNLSQYGFGWRIFDIRGHKLIGHTGQTAGFGAANFRYPDDSVDVIVLTNLGENGLGGQIAARIAKFYVPDMSLKALKGKPEVVAGLGDKLMTAFRARNEEKLDISIFSPDLARSLSSERARASYRRIASLGTPIKITFIDSDESGTNPSYRYRVEFSRKLILWKVTVNEDGKLTELSLDEEE